MHKLGRKSGILLLWILLVAVQLAAQEFTTITVKEGQTIRDVAREYLNDPDLWQLILDTNRLETAADVRPGMTLQIPATMVTQATTELVAAREAISDATALGARVFAPDAIEQALELHESALIKRKANAWDECYDLAKQSHTTALEALKISREKRNQPGEAILNQRRGEVQNRRPTDLLWKETPLKAVLIESEKVRTLTQSFAEILFRDESQLRLGENSQAVIQKMRVDLLENKQESKVELVAGDIYALLSGNQARNAIDVETPDVSTDARSSKFWVGRDQNNTARFANYEGELDVSAAGSKVTLTSNQGTKVAQNQPPTPPRDLLPAPLLQNPPDGTERFDAATTFSWEAVAGARAYWLEVATNPEFDQLEVSRKDISETEFLASDLPDGLHYWRVASIDNDNFPGPWSDSRFFKLIRDEQPPFLVITRPMGHTTVSTSEIDIQGEVEAGATLTLNGQSITTAADGDFTTTVTLSPGANTLTLVATDAAANTTEKTVHITRREAAAVGITLTPNAPQLSPGQFLSQSTAFTLKGHTNPNATVQLNVISNEREQSNESEQSNLAGLTIADSDGNFQVNVNVHSPRSRYHVQVTDPAGQVAHDTITVLVDNTPPTMSLNPRPPHATSSEIVTLSGSVADDVTPDQVELMLNGEPIAVQNGYFEHMFALSDGENVLHFTGKDKAGNRTEITHTIRQDTTPPILKSYSVSAKAATSGETVTIHIAATDETGLKAGARYTLRIGTVRHSGFLTRCDSGDCYEGKLVIPVGASGDLVLESVVLEDVVGNVKTDAFMNE